MTELEARKLVNSLAPMADGWWKGTPESLVKMAIRLSLLGVSEDEIRTLLDDIITDLRSEYGD